MLALQHRLAHDQIETCDERQKPHRWMGRLLNTTSSVQHSMLKGSWMNQGALTLPYAASRACSRTSTASLDSSSLFSCARTCCGMLCR